MLIMSACYTSKTPSNMVEGVFKYYFFSTTLGCVNGAHNPGCTLRYLSKIDRLLVVLESAIQILKDSNRENRDATILKVGQITIKGEIEQDGKEKNIYHATGDIVFIYFLYKDHGDGSAGFSQGILNMSVKVTSIGLKGLEGYRVQVEVQIYPLP